MTCSVEEIRLSLPHIELAAHLFGPQDGIPVIALHGWLDNANSFARLAPKLEGLRILALDMAGHGHSDHRPPGSAYRTTPTTFCRWPGRWGGSALHCWVIPWERSFR
jgi:pimeloyl-ACP methyl ester carboxylesterase